MSTLAALAAYGSDSDDSAPGDEGTAAAAPAERSLGASLPAPKSSAGEPDAKRRRTFQLPVPAPKYSAKSDGESSDDEDAKRFAANRKSSSLLASLPAPKNSATSVRDTAPQASSAAYEEALARKKNPRQLAAALFEKQLQTTREKAGSAVEQGGSDDAPVEHTSSSHLEPGGTSAEAGAYRDRVERAVPVLPEGWSAAWDDSAQAYYYYNAAGRTQWEVPVLHGGGNQASAGAPPSAVDDPSLPEELRRELKKQARRGGGSYPPDLANCAPVITQGDFWKGEKHREYTAMSSAYHVPMNAPEQLKPGQLAKRKHQITDVLHQAAANELKYLDSAAVGRKSRQQVNAKYGW